MRHLRREKHLGRNPSHRKALRRNLVSSFLLLGRIQTTPEKARQTQQFAEKLIAIARDETLASFRRILALVNDKRVVRRLFKDIAPKFKDRAGGYTRITKLGTDHNRLGDNAPQAILELVEEIPPEKKGKEAGKSAEPVEAGAKGKKSKSKDKAKSE